jgi:hypothetical protein
LYFISELYSHNPQGVYFNLASKNKLLANNHQIQIFNNENRKLVILFDYNNLNDIPYSEEIEFYFLVESETSDITNEININMGNDKYWYEILDNMVINNFIAIDDTSSVLTQQYRSDVDVILDVNYVSINNKNYLKFDIESKNVNQITGIEFNYVIYGSTVYNGSDLSNIDISYGDGTKKIVYKKSGIFLEESINGLLSNNNIYGNSKLIFIPDSVTLDNIKSSNKFTLFYMLVNREPTALNINNVIITRNNTIIYDNYLRLVGNDAFNFLNTYGNRSESIKNYYENKISIRSHSVININIPIFEESKQYALIPDPLMSLNTFNEYDVDWNNYYTNTTPEQLVGKKYPPWNYSTFTYPYASKLTIKDIINFLKIIVGKITYFNNREIYERINGRIDPNGEEGIDYIYDESSSSFYDKLTGIQIPFPEESEFNNNILNENSSYKHRYDLAIAATEGLDKPPNILDVLNLINTLIFKRPIFKIPSVFLPEDFNNSNSNNLINLTNKKILSSYYEDYIKVTKPLKLLTNNIVNPFISINLLDISNIPVLKIDISSNLSDIDAKYGWSGFEFMIAFRRYTGYLNTVNINTVIDLSVYGYEKIDDNNVYIIPSENNIPLQNIVKSKSKFKFSDLLNNFEIDQETIVNLRKMIFYIQPDSENNEIYPTFKENISLYIPITVIGSKPIQKISVYDVNITDNGFDNSGIVNDYQGSQLNINDLLEVWPEIKFLDLNEDSIENLDLNNRDLSFALILDQSGDNILFKTDKNTELTGLIMYFDNSFELATDIYDLSTNSFKDSYINSVNSDLNGWYVAYNSNYNNYKLGSNMIIIMWTIASNGITSDNLDASNILFKIPTSSNGNISNLLWVDQIADQNANDITQQLILINQENRNDVTYPNILNKKYPILVNDLYQPLLLSNEQISRNGILLEYLVYILDYIEGISMEEPIKHRILLGGDYTGNGEITIADYINFKNLLLGNINKIGYVENELINNSGSNLKMNLNDKNILSNVVSSEKYIKIVSELLTFEDSNSGGLYKNLLKLKFISNDLAKYSHYRSFTLEQLEISGGSIHSYNLNDKYGEYFGSEVNINDSNKIIHDYDDNIETIEYMDNSINIILFVSHDKYSLDTESMHIYIPIEIDDLSVNKGIIDFSYNNFNLNIGDGYNNNITKIVNDCSNVIVDTNSFNLEGDITVLFKNSGKRIKIPFTQTQTTNIYLIVNKLNNEDISFVTSEENDELAHVSTHSLSNLVNLVVRENENYKAVIIDPTIPLKRYLSQEIHPNRVLIPNSFDFRISGNNISMIHDSDGIGNPQSVPTNHFEDYNFKN